MISLRRTKPWARTYKVRAERLIAEDRMQQTGPARIAAAKASGGWDEKRINATTDEAGTADASRATVEAAAPGVAEAMTLPRRML